MESMARAWFLRLFSNSSGPRPWHAALTRGLPAWSPLRGRGSCGYSRTPLPSRQSCGQSPDGPGQAPERPSEPCSPPALFVQLVDGAATVTKLIKQIFDLIGEVLVLTLDDIELLHSLIIASLKAEDLGAVVPSFAPAGLQLGHQVVSLCLPLSHHLVKVLSPLLGDDGGGVCALVFHLEIFQLNLNAVLGLLGGSNLGVERVNGLFGFVNTSTKLRLVAFELVNAAKCLSLKLGFPQLDLSLSLGKGTQGVVLALGLLFDSHLHVLAVSCQVLVLGQERGTVTSLSISKPLC